LSNEPPVVLDTSVISRIMRKDPSLPNRLAQLLGEEPTLLLCPVVFFEIERGLRSKPEAVRIRYAFEALKGMFIYRELDKLVWKPAADRWAEQSLRGRKPQDADLLIAAYADRHGARLITYDKGLESLAKSVECWED